MLRFINVTSTSDLLTKKLFSGEDRYFYTSRTLFCSILFKCVSDEAFQWWDFPFSSLIYLLKQKNWELKYMDLKSRLPNNIDSVDST